MCCPSLYGIFVTLARPIGPKIYMSWLSVVISGHPGSVLISKWKLHIDYKAQFSLVSTNAAHPAFHSFSRRKQLGSQKIRDRKFSARVNSHLRFFCAVPCFLVPRFCLFRHKINFCVRKTVSSRVELFLRRKTQTSFHLQNPHILAI